MTTFLVLVLFVMVAGAVAFYTVSRTTVFEFERGLKYVNGRLESVLTTGAYWHVPFWTQIRKVDVRPRFVSIVGQEVLSADGVTLKMSLAARYQVVDPKVAVNEIDDYQQALYLELQLGLRELTGAAAVDELLEKRPEFGRRLFELKRGSIEKLGLSLMSVDVKDVMFPGELKRIFAEVVKARKEGQAALERARAETATLRHLANATEAIDRNPTLLQLRLLQAVEGSSGNTIVLGVPGTMAPLIVPGREPAPAKKKGRAKAAASEEA
jgi:regulator of protease activity HflC (stomatin/prohibitin superfamily)